jgi:hypothetical protein
MTGGWLLDTSAIAISARPQVLRRLRPMLRAGVLYTCPVLDLEALAVARTPEAYRKLAIERRAAYQAVAITGSIGERALKLQARLARRAHFRAIEGRDLLVAATAIENDLAVLHHLQIFELLGDLGELEQSPVAPLGPRR